MAEFRNGLPDNFEDDNESQVEVRQTIQMRGFILERPEDAGTKYMSGIDGRSKILIEI